MPASLSEAGTFSDAPRKHPAETAVALGTAALIGIGTAVLLLGSVDARFDRRRRFLPPPFRRPKPTKGRLIAGAAGTSAGIAATFVLLDALLTHRRVIRLDRHLHNYFRAHRTKRQERVVDATTVVGNGWFIVPAAAAAAWELNRRDDARAALAVIWSVAGASVWSEALKRGIRRPRPTEGREENDDYSFPSGHTLLAGSLYGLLAYIVATRKDLGPARFPSAALLSLTAPWTAFSRMYLGRHWPSDTVASAALATAWNATLITFLRAR